MEFLSKHLSEMMDVSGGTYTLLFIICGTAVWLIRDSIASSLSMIIIFPLVMFLSLLACYLCSLADLYDPKKMADWLIWTIMAATGGTLLGIGMVATFAKMWEREPSPSTT